jgi:hypothetical protein
MMDNMTISEGILDWTWEVKEEAMYSRERRQAEGNSVSEDNGLNHQLT